MAKQPLDVSAPRLTLSALHWPNTISRKYLMLLLEPCLCDVALKITENGRLAEHLPGMAAFQEMVSWLCQLVIKLRLPSLHLPRVRGKHHFVVGLEGASLIMPLSYAVYIEFCHYWQTYACLSMLLKHHTQVYIQQVSSESCNVYLTLALHHVGHLLLSFIFIYGWLFHAQVNIVVSKPWG